MSAMVCARGCELVIIPVCCLEKYEARGVDSAMAVSLLLERGSILGEDSPNEPLEDVCD